MSSPADRLRLEELRSRSLRAAGPGLAREEQDFDTPPGSPGAAPEFVKSNSWADVPANNPNPNPRATGNSTPPLYRPSRLNAQRLPSPPNANKRSAAFDFGELRNEIAARSEQLQGALAAYRELEQQLHSQEGMRARAEAQRETASLEASILRVELNKKDSLLQQQRELLEALQDQVDEQHATQIEQLLRASKDSTAGASVPAGSADLDLQVLKKLQGEVEVLRQEKLEAGDEVEELKAELEASRNEQGQRMAAEENEGLSQQVEELSQQVEELSQQVTLLQDALEEAKEEKEATVSEFLTQVMSLSTKLTNAKKDREAAVHAAERKMEVVKRELASVVEQNERNAEEMERARTSIAKAEEYLKALDVARVEIKRLRIERDMMIERLRNAEETLRSKGVDLTSWIVPTCLLQHSGGGGGKGKGRPRTPQLLM